MAVSAFKVVMQITQSQQLAPLFRHMKCSELPRWLSLFITSALSGSMRQSYFCTGNEVRWGGYLEDHGGDGTVILRMDLREVVRKDRRRIELCPTQAFVTAVLEFGFGYHSVRRRANFSLEDLHLFI
jgi:hypothetical protein